MQRKAFQVVMRRTETRTSEQIITVHADTKEDALVLAKYEELPSYLWDHVGDANDVKIAFVKEADDPVAHYGNLAQVVQQQTAAGDARN